MFCCRFIATVVAFSALFTSALALPAAGINATAQAQRGHQLSPNQFLTTYLQALRTSTQELQALRDPNDLVEPEFLPRLKQLVAEGGQSAVDLLASLSPGPLGLEQLKALLGAEQNLSNEVHTLLTQVPPELREPLSSILYELENLDTTLNKIANSG